MWSMLRGLRGWLSGEGSGALPLSDGGGGSAATAVPGTRFVAVGRAAPMVAPEGLTVRPDDVLPTARDERTEAGAGEALRSLVPFELRSAFEPMSGRSAELRSGELAAGDVAKTLGEERA